MNKKYKKTIIFILGVIACATHTIRAAAPPARETKFPRIATAAGAPAAAAKKLSEAEQKTLIAKLIDKTNRYYIGKEPDQQLSAEESKILFEYVCFNNNIPVLIGLLAHMTLEEKELVVMIARLRRDKSGFAMPKIPSKRMIRRTVSSSGDIIINEGPKREPRNEALLLFLETAHVLLYPNDKTDTAKLIALFNKNDDPYLLNYLIACLYKASMGAHLNVVKTLLENRSTARNISVVDIEEILRDMEKFSSDYRKLHNVSQTIKALENFLNNDQFAKQQYLKMGIDNLHQLVEHKDPISEFSDRQVLAVFEYACRIDDPKMLQALLSYEIVKEDNLMKMLANTEHDKKIYLSLSALYSFFYIHTTTEEVGRVLRENFMDDHKEANINFHEYTAIRLKIACENYEFDVIMTIINNHMSDLKNYEYVAKSAFDDLANMLDARQVPDDYRKNIKKAALKLKYFLYSETAPRDMEPAAPRPTTPKYRRSYDTVTDDEPAGPAAPPTSPAEQAAETITTESVDPDTEVGSQTESGNPDEL